MTDVMNVKVNLFIITIICCLILYWFVILNGIVFAVAMLMPCCVPVCCSCASNLVARTMNCQWWHKSFSHGRRRPSMLCLATVTRWGLAVCHLDSQRMFSFIC